MTYQQSQGIPRRIAAGIFAPEFPSRLLVLLLHLLILTHFGDKDGLADNDNKVTERVYRLIAAGRTPNEAVTQVNRVVGKKRRTDVLDRH